MPRTICRRPKAEARSREKEPEAKRCRDLNTQCLHQTNSYKFNSIQGHVDTKAPKQVDDVHGAPLEDIYEYPEPCPLVLEKPGL